MAMRVTLLPHPTTPAPPFMESFEVDVSRHRFGLSLDYMVRGDTSAMAIAGSAEPARRDELWRTTCFEAFVCEQPGGAYVELNLSPSNEWAAYGFTSYRSDMRPLEQVPDPEIRVVADEALLELFANVDLTGVPAVSILKPWYVGISAVIEGADGNRSYWALAHPPGEPDFHHRDCFALQLPPPKRP
jgi:hypothetical protein